MRGRFGLAAVLGAVLLLGACHMPPHRARVRVHAPLTRPIGSTGIYWAYDMDGDVFYYNGYWYWCDGPDWYYSTSWGGGWVYVSEPPGVFLSIPTGHARHRVVFRHPRHREYRKYRTTHYPDRVRPPSRRGFGELPTSRRAERGLTRSKTTPVPRRTEKRASPIRKVAPKPDRGKSPLRKALPEPKRGKSPLKKRR